MTPLDTFSSIVDPEGRYYPFQPSKQVPYPGDFTKYGFKPEWVHFQSIEAPPPAPTPDNPDGMGPWQGPGSYWDTPGADQSFGDGPNGQSGNDGNSPNNGPASPDTAAQAADIGTTVAGLAGGFFGGPLGSAAAKGAATVAGVNAVANEFAEAYGIPGHFDPVEAFKSAVSFGLTGHNNETQVAANTPGINDDGFSGTTSDPASTFGRGSHPGETDGNPGGGPSGGDVSDPSTSGGSAGAGDSDGAPSGTWHAGGPVYDGDPQTLRQDMPIVAQEGEYVLPRYVVDAFGIDALDMLRKAVAPNGQFQRGSGEMNALPETLLRHSTPR